eukprot:scaffold1839_cov382-Prasinococcus_capsulatus_cf.AAC.30
MLIVCSPWSNPLYSCKASVVALTGSAKMNFSGTGAFCANVAADSAVPSATITSRTSGFSVNFFWETSSRA